MVYLEIEKQSDWTEEPTEDWQTDDSKSSLVSRCRTRRACWDVCATKAMDSSSSGQECDNALIAPKFNVSHIQPIEYLKIFFGADIKENLKLLNVLHNNVRHSTEICANSDKIPTNVLLNNELFCGDSSLWHDFSVQELYDSLKSVIKFTYFLLIV